jgi:hypothetical protein
MDSLHDTLGDSVLVDLDKPEDDEYIGLGV